MRNGCRARLIYRFAIIAITTIMTVPPVGDFSAFARAFAPTFDHTSWSTPVPVAADDTYMLGTGDKLRIIVFGETDLGGEYVVDGTGYVQMPLIGEVEARGLSVRQFEKAVSAKLADGYLKDPRVSIEVVNYRPFSILGEVKNPGNYPYVNGMTVLNAVALAGGFTDRANESEVYIRHAGSAKEAEVPVDGTTKINPGDIIRVKERFF